MHGHAPGDGTAAPCSAPALAMPPAGVCACCCFRGAWRHPKTVGRTPTPPPCSRPAVWSAARGLQVLGPGVQQPDSGPLCRHLQPGRSRRGLMPPAGRQPACRAAAASPADALLASPCQRRAGPHPPNTQGLQLQASGRESRHGPGREPHGASLASGDDHVELPRRGFRCRGGGGSIMLWRNGEIAALGGPSCWHLGRSVGALLACAWRGGPSLYPLAPPPPKNPHPVHA